MVFNGKGSSNTTTPNKLVFLSHQTPLRPKDKAHNNRSQARCAKEFERLQKDLMNEKNFAEVRLEKDFSAKQTKLRISYCHRPVDPDYRPKNHLNFCDV